MAHRNSLLAKLRAYRATNPPKSELEAISATEQFVLANPRCFERELLVGHITGSAWLLSPDLQQVCLTHHKKLNKWLQLGGHADGDPNILSVALREAREESGIENIIAVSENIFDVSVHPVPEHKGVPGHLHYDIRFLVRAQSMEPLLISEESLNLAWFRHDDAFLDTCGPTMQPLIAKWRAMLTSVELIV